ncbi:plasmid stabilization system protein ParE [Sphingobium sp. OAS761]|uniref:type II toxin-antitoxin system RelE/ParE family toxin n=1 Tax=Sphingobium sp. OAS761 TaxID=2817901 RepID=UPI0020A05932|nr:type II toxin-antitoxin system RelE/ParE family toxin [Sphingobium sp. OAS761]MCP1470996.1 plasmid stabilization system protein ParE [Sphingobium sp. OAS761]
MKVVLTAEALGDLERIGDYIAQDNPNRARSFVAELLAKARGLRDLPEGFPLVPRYAHLGIRRRVHGSYLIFYRIEAQQISILHILHGARDYEALLFPDA